MRLPKVVHDALGLFGAGLGECAMFRAASVGARAVLAEFIRCVDKVEPTAPIRICDRTIAAALGGSVRSVQRWKRELEDRGWIERRQYRTRKRPFDLCHVRLRDEALRALGLAQARAASASAGRCRRRVGAAFGPVDNPVESYPQRAPILAHALDTIPQLSSKGQTALPAPALDGPQAPRLDAGEHAQQTQALEGTCTRLSASEERLLHDLQARFGDALDAMPDPLSLEVDPDGGGLLTLPVGAWTEPGSIEALAVADGETRGATMGGVARSSTLVGMPAPPSIAASLPADLVPLGDAGIGLSGVHALMGLASRAGHRLGDIVAATAPHILRARHPFAYVRKLVRAGHDWAAIARAQYRAPGDGNAPASATPTGQSSERQAEDRRIAVVLSGVAPGVVYGHETVPYVWQRVDTVILQALRDQVVNSAGCRVGTTAIDHRWRAVVRPAAFVRDWDGGKIRALPDTVEVVSDPTSAPDGQARDAQAVSAALPGVHGAQR